MTRATYDVTYEIGSEDGDVAESGFVARGLTLREAVACVADTRTRHVGGVEAIECDSSPPADPRWITVYNGSEYYTGARESRSLHMPDCLTASTRGRIARIVGVTI